MKKFRISNFKFRIPGAVGFMNWGPRVLHAFLRCLNVTCRVRYESIVETRDRGTTPRIYVAWHRDMLMLAHPCRHHVMTVVVSRSRDGELAARTAQRLGYRVVRGSSSRGGISVLKELIAMVREGHPVGLFADGPRGPARQTKAGVVYLAQKTGALLVPLAAKAGRAVTFRSWDRMVLPLPFTRVSILQGEPFTIPADVRRKDLLHYSRLLTERLDNLHHILSESP